MPYKGIACVKERLFSCRADERDVLRVLFEMRANDINFSIFDGTQEMQATRLCVRRVAFKTGGQQREQWASVPWQIFGGRHSGDCHIIVSTSDSKTLRKPSQMNKIKNRLLTKPLNC